MKATPEEELEGQSITATLSIDPWELHLRAEALRLDARNAVVDFITAHRQAARITQHEAERQARVNHGDVNKLEKGIWIGPSADKLVQYIKQQGFIAGVKLERGKKPGYKHGRPYVTARLKARRADFLDLLESLLVTRGRRG